MFSTLLRQGLSAPIRQRASARLFSNVAFRMNAVNTRLNKDSFVYKYLESGPKTVKFTPEHEWLAVFEDDTAFVGITKYASEALGDATYIELPEVGDRVEIGDSIGSVESVKSASEIYSPVTGEIIAINNELESNAQIINLDPMGAAWIAQIKLDAPESIETSEELLTAEEYESSLEEQ